jgi:hypothetical protein
MRLSDQRIKELQAILKQHFGLDYDSEQAQQAGLAILKLVAFKLYQQMNKENNDGKTEQPQGGGA